MADWLARALALLDDTTPVQKVQLVQKGAQPTLTALKTLTASALIPLSGVLASIRPAGRACGSRALPSSAQSITSPAFLSRNGRSYSPRPLPFSIAGAARPLGWGGTKLISSDAFNRSTDGASHYAKLANGSGW